jgi:hypothetical protein
MSEAEAGQAAGAASSSATLPIDELAELRSEIRQTSDMAGAAFDAAVSAIGALQIALQILDRKIVSIDEKEALSKAEAHVKHASDKLLSFMVS